MVLSPVPVSRAHPLVARVLATTFPDYRGRKVSVAPWSGPVSLDWNWDGGSRDFVAVVDTAGGRVAHAEVPAPWSHQHRPVAPCDFPDGYLLVVHSIFCGRDAGVTIYAKPSDRLLGTGDTK